MKHLLKIIEEDRDEKNMEPNVKITDTISQIIEMNIQMEHII